MDALAQSVPLVGRFLTDPQFWLILTVALVLAGPIGMIPGVGSLTIASVIVPFAILNMEPALGIMLIASILSLANTMDSVPAILLGYVTAPTQVTFLEGHQLAQRGDAAYTLGAVYAVSTIGGIAGAAILALILPAVRPFIVRFSFPEITAMAVFGILMISVLSRGAFLKGLGSAMLGLMLAMIGLSAFSAEPRFTFGTLYLNGGLPIIPVVIGMFALPEVLDLTMTGRPVSASGERLSTGRLLEGVSYGMRRWAVAVRHGIFGVGLGMIPGVGAGVIDWLSYVMGMAFTRDKSQFGKGSMDGLIFAESAQNAQNAGQAVPTLGFGIPGSLPWAILLAAMLGFGVAPGLSMLGQNLNITVGVVLAIGIGNVLMCLLALALTPFIMRLTLIPYPFIAGTLIPLMFLAAYQSSQNIADIYVVLGTGALGLAMKWFGWPRPPFIIAFILGPIVEQNAWPALQMGQGPLIFVARPFALGILLLGAAVIAFLLWTLRSPGKQQRTLERLVPSGATDQNGPAQDAAALPARRGVRHWQWQWEYVLWALLAVWVGGIVLRQTLTYVAGAAFVPLWSSIIFLVILATLLLRSFVGRQGDVQIMDIGMRAGTGLAATRRLVPLIAWILGFVVAIGVIGFQFAALFFPVVYIPLTVRLRGVQWLWILASVALVALVIFGLMDNLFHVFWPRPFIREWLFG